MSDFKSDVFNVRFQIGRLVLEDLGVEVVSQRMAVPFRLASGGEIRFQIESLKTSDFEKKWKMRAPWIKQKSDVSFWETSDPNLN